MEFRNVIITPHSSGLTTDYDERNAALIVPTIFAVTMTERRC